MPNVFNRQTLENVKTTDFPEFNEKDYLVNPDLSAVKDTPRENWTIEGDTIRVKTEEEIQASQPGVGVIIKPPIEDPEPEFDCQARIEALEERVSALETAVAQLEGKS